METLVSVCVEGQEQKDQGVEVGSRAVGRKIEVGVWVQLKLL